jgi:hypothetical protein
MTTTDDWKDPRKVKYFSEGKAKGKFTETETCGALWWVQGKPRIPILLNGKRVHVWLDQLEPVPEPVMAMAPYPAGSPWSGLPDDLAADAEFRALIVAEMDQHRKEMKRAIMTASDIMRAHEEWANKHYRAGAAIFEPLLDRCLEILRESNEKCDGSG